MKVCSKCGEEKPFSAFGPFKLGKNGLRPSCRDCHNKSNAAWRKSNPNYFGQWREENPDAHREWTEKNRAHRTRYQEKYNRSDAGRARNKKAQINRYKRKQVENRNRSGRQKLATPFWADTNKIKSIYWEARRLNSQLSEFGPWAVDHVVPLSGKNVCGLHVHYNLRIVTRHQNSVKGNSFSH